MRGQRHLQWKLQLLCSLRKVLQDSRQCAPTSALGGGGKWKNSTCKNTPAHSLHEAAQQVRTQEWPEGGGGGGGGGLGGGG